MRLQASVESDVHDRLEYKEKKKVVDPDLVDFQNSFNCIMLQLQNKCPTKNSTSTTSNNSWMIIRNKSIQQSHILR